MSETISSSFLRRLRRLANDLITLARMLGRKKTFRAPPRAAALIFDRYGSDHLKKTVLFDVDCHVMAARFEEINLSPRVAGRLVANYFRHVLFQSRQSSYVPKGRGGAVYNMYHLSYAQVVRPKVVITWIEDSPDFHALARLHREAAFIAVQNGLKFVSTASVFQPPYADGARKDMDMFCFGDRDVDLFSKRAPHVAFHPVGSLLGSCYKYKAGGDARPICHDICLTSVRKRSILDNKDGTLSHCARGLADLDGFLRRYLDARGERLRLCIAGRAMSPEDKKEERDHYGSLFFGLEGVELTFVEYDQEKFSSYGAMLESRIVVTLYSTTGLEAFGWGKKVLFCAFHALDDRRALPEGDWFLPDPDYKEFKRRLDALLDGDDETYLATNRELMGRMMRDDPERPAYACIREKVLAALRKNNATEPRWKT